MGSKFSGKIGYSMTVEDPIDSGIYKKQIIEKHHYGDFKRSGIRYQSGVSTNDNLIMSNRISIIANKFMRDNSHRMVYVTINGGRWKITSAEFDRPRIMLTIGGVYNGPKADSPTET